MQIGCFWTHGFFRNSGHVDCGNQILVDETNEDMTTRMLARLSEDSNRR